MEGLPALGTGRGNWKHGGARNGQVERLHNIWRDLKKRCHTPSNSNFRHYGGRGIGVCNEWRHDYVAFRSWSFANGYADHLTIDRIDNDSGYSPTNCRWVDRTAQARNRRSSRLLTAFGQTKPLSEWAEIAGITASLLSARIDKNGWDIEQALSIPALTSQQTRQILWEKFKPEPPGLLPSHFKQNKTPT